MYFVGLPPSLANFHDPMTPNSNSQREVKYAISSEDGYFCISYIVGQS